jgi:hypothetical protein
LGLLSEDGKFLLWIRTRRPRKITNSIWNQCPWEGDVELIGLLKSQKCCSLYWRSRCRLRLGPVISQLLN